jgi:GntR family transcriptional regulator
MKIEIDHTSAVPLHLQVEALLRKMTSNPEYLSGKLFPNEVDLAKKLGISRNTLRQAANKLVHEGLLLRKKGVGTVVTSPVNSKSKNWMSFSEEMKLRGLEIKNYSTLIRWTYPSEEVACFFGIDSSTKLLRMQRVRGDFQKPFVYFVSYFSPRIGLTGTEDFNKPLYELLENEFSVVAKVCKEEICALASSPEIAALLKISVGEPLLKRKRLIYDPGRRPIEYNVGYYKSDSIIVSIESEG